MARGARSEPAEGAAPTAELPPEVLERLSVFGKVRLTVGEDAAFGVDATVAPLNKQLFLLVARGGATEDRLMEDPRATILAEDRGNEWLVRATGRAVPGRPVPAEPRRTELMHWLPDGVGPAGLVAVRFHPETVEYVQGKGTGRARVAGPIPGAAPPPAISRWALLATDGVVAWFFALAALDWLGLFFLVDEQRRTVMLLSLLVVTGACLLGGVQLLDQAARFTRWREGLETDAAARLVTHGWEAPRRIRDAGLGMMALGAVLAVLVSAGTGSWRVGGWAVLASGAPLVGLFHAARHLLRRKDADRENG